MSSLPRIDIHAHAFHPKIASKVVEQLQHHYGIPAIGNGLLEDMEPRLRRAGIQYSAVLAAATPYFSLINWSALALVRISSTSESESLSLRRSNSISSLQSKSG